MCKDCRKCRQGLTACPAKRPMKSLQAPPLNILLLLRPTCNPSPLLRRLSPASLCPTLLLQFFLAPKLYLSSNPPFTLYNTQWRSQKDHGLRSHISRRGASHGTCVGCHEKLCGTHSSTIQGQATATRRKLCHGTWDIKDAQKHYGLLIGEVTRV